MTDLAETTSRDVWFDSAAHPERKDLFSPLRDVRIVDLTKVLSGPTCTQYLSDMGANVIKIEAKDGGDDSRSWPPINVKDGAIFLSCNRNKRSIAVDLKAAEGRDIVTNIAKTADVFIESNRTGASKRLGMDYDSIRKVNPRIIYVSISGYGRTGPLAALPGYDLALQAHSGIMSLCGEADRSPMRTPFSPLDQTTGVHAALGILAALRERDRSGEGRYLEVSLFETAIAFLGFIAQMYWTDHKPPHRNGTAHSSITPYQVFPTKDGYVLLAVGNDNLWQKFCDGVGKPQYKTDPRYSTNAQRTSRFAESVALVSEWMRGRTSAEWIEIMNRQGVPCTPVSTLVEAFDIPHVRERKMLLDYEHPEYGPLHGVAQPILFGGYTRDVRSPPPMLGQHTQEILAALGYSSSDIETLHADGVVRTADRS